MQKKLKTAFVCNNCGQDYSKWHGKCDNCGTWDTITEIKISTSKSWTGQTRSTNTTPVLLSDCTQKETLRVKSSFNEIDRVLGGGLVRGAFVLVGGDPGIGKSTVLLQLAARLADTGM